MEYTECRTFAADVVDRAKSTMKADGCLRPILFAFNAEGKMQVVHLQGPPEAEIADIARAAVKEVGAYAAVVANEATFAEMCDGQIYRQYHFDAIAVACVHPNGHTVWITPFAKEHGITFGQTKVMDGQNFSGPITEILK